MVQQMILRHSKLCLINIGDAESSVSLQFKFKFTSPLLLHKLSNFPYFGNLDFDAGTYLISDTLKIPAGSFVVGELWSNIVASGSKFASASSPHVAVQIGNPGDTAATEISDLVFTTTSGMAGAIVVEWNVGNSAQGSAAMWDSHVRLGGYKGSNIQVGNCGASGSHPTSACTSSYLALHLTSSSSAYLEVSFCDFYAQPFTSAPHLTRTVLSKECVGVGRRS